MIGYMIRSNGKRVNNRVYHYKESAISDIERIGHTEAYVVKVKMEILDEEEARKEAEWHRKGITASVL